LDVLRVGGTTPEGASYVAEVTRPSGHLVKKGQDLVRGRRLGFWHHATSMPGGSDKQTSFTLIDFRPSTPRGRRLKRLTLDLTPDLHRALKVRAAELDIPMVELLRELIDAALKDASVLEGVAARLRPRDR
jgi:hypothetical protein